MARLTTDDFRVLLQNEMADYGKKVTIGIGKMPEMRDMFVYISQTGNGIDVMQGIFEKKNFLIESRGINNDLKGSENLANAVYERLHLQENLDLENDIRVLSIRCVQKPRQLTFQDFDGRFIFTAEYEVVSSQD